MADLAVDEQPEQGDWGGWRARIAAARKLRDEKVPTWQENVAKRSNSPDSDALSETSVSINPDWELTKAKIANLYSQTPEVRLQPRRGFEQFRPAIGSFGQELNDTISDASVGSTIEEVLADVVNAAGIGAVKVFCEKRTEKRSVPEVDPATLPPEAQKMLASGAIDIPMVEVDHVVDLQNLCERISSADLLIPSDFTGSNYDKSRWLGNEGRMTGPQAIRELGLTEDQLEEALGTDKRAGANTHSLNTDTNKFRDTEVVNYTEIFYWRHFYHAEETSFKAIQRIVFVDGLDEPVINEPYKAQQRDEMTGAMVGVTKLPIRVLTLTYISDSALPPSDSSISRYTVDELEESRDSMQKQRKHSIPIRWYDPNRVSQNTRDLLNKGTHQGFVPIANGERGIGEVARASFPNEKFEFDRILKTELAEKWQVGSNQAGNFAPGERSAREAGIIENNFQRRVGQEQDKVQKFFIGIAEVLAGHLALYGTFDLPDTIGHNRAALANAFTYSVRVDSTVRLDAEQRIEQLNRALNLTAQSGYVNPKAAIEEIWELSGMDPAKVVIDPQPKPPEPVKLSCSNAADLKDPVMLAALMRTQQAPTPEDLTAAIKMLQEVMAAMATGAVPMPQAQPQSDGTPPAEVETPGIANAEWEAAPRLDRRQEDGGA